MTAIGYRIHVRMAIAALSFAAAHLAFEHFNGGVVSHHLLNRADLPAISNWFGLLVLPALAWVLAVRVRAIAASSGSSGSQTKVVAGLLAAAVYGAVLAVAFEFDREAVTSSMFLGLFALAAALPIYRIECVLGFVVGMTFTFGAVLPTLIAGMLALLSALLNPLLRFLLRTLVAVTRGASGRSSDQTH